MLAASLALPDMVELLANKGANVNFQKGNKSSVGESFLVNPLHFLTLVSIFSILFCIHFLRC